MKRLQQSLGIKSRTPSLCIYEKILMPYISCKRKELKVGTMYPALVIFDNFTGQMTENIMKLLEDNNVSVVTVPANCTDRLQPATTVSRMVCK